MEKVAVKALYGMRTEKATEDCSVDELPMVLGTWAAGKLATLSPWVASRQAKEGTLVIADD